MKFTEITLPARNPKAVATGWRDLLELEVEIGTDRSSVTCGWTRLHWVADPTFASSHHLAITIPDDIFADAKRWISARTPLLTDADGNDEWETGPGWNGQNLYFDGPETSVLEFIPRRARGDRGGEPFGVEHLRGISEVGVAGGVAEAVADLADANWAPYGEEPGPSFAAVGDVDALFIVVSPGRSWYPTQDRLVAPVRTEVTATGSTRGTFRVSDDATLTVV